ncbi:SRPBCC domain-containing protein [Paenalcaligenes niemegkensis]|uniref:CoxG family protein n=1 Tax=Paenalcaligenes niemegkensis TaxID=2895469 RepID=UPI001EE78A2F|nr:SRPBCC domain-containing protein [Paenalcaligenes niemegkensis]MCQ9617709.1 SRPBCC domain-containing protein [Paenalcaligenes niemegkensis]
MKFESQTTIQCEKEAIWSLLFDVSRVAELIPGCSDVEEIEVLKEYSALIKQKVGPFRFAMPCEISVDEYLENERVGITATGKDNKTATSVFVQMVLTLSDEDEGEGVVIDVDADIQITGKLATLGHPIVKRKCNDIFKEFDKNLHNELEMIDEAKEV